MAKAKKPAKSKRQRDAEDLEVYNNVVFQDGRVMAGPNDMGFLEIAMVNSTFAVMLNFENAEHLIRELQDFVKGRAPHFARDQN